AELVERGAGTAESRDGIERPPQAPTQFTRQLVDGVEANRDGLDRLIEEQAIDWHIERIAPLERAILRVALFEMLHRPDVPDEVAIDEAVEAAKDLCAADAAGFVNGILGTVKRTEVRS